MSKGPSSIFATFLAAVVIAAPITARSAEPCNLQLAFARPDERGTQKVNVYEAAADPLLGGAKPLVFISDLKVNTDGTRISYKVDDPHAKNGAINDIRNAMHKGHTIAEFENIAKSDWQPLARTWQVLSMDVIEKDRKTGKPCVGANNFLVSMTADVAVANGWNRVGDCDQSKWIDALTIPALVLPKNSEFQTKKALTRNFVVIRTLGQRERTAYGIVGDTGPEDELGEASVEMNRILNDLPVGEVPKNSRDAVKRFQGPKSLVLIFPGNFNRLKYPVTPQRVGAEVKARFEAWGGQDRLESCLENIPQTGR
jgi:Fungal chitosanase of glycosyl hydrolase group 75